ncbi:hypothetical protein FQN51_006730 [Onygenales sp. PD_10]|nr:hypothetical protein FQN51_006730 [Onygenales sp. PD_10]
MKHTLSSTLLGTFLLLTRTTVLGQEVLPNVILLCDQFWSYADGGLYCRNKPGTESCLGDLGDFPAERSFPWFAQLTDDLLLHLTEQTSSRNYITYRDSLYIDTSPGAFAPLRFTPDNSTLTGGETAWAWTTPAGFPFWTPTGRVADGTAGGDGAIIGQGFQVVDVEGHPGVRQAYWNQTKFEEMYAGREDGGLLTVCYGDYDPESITQGDSP